MEQFTKSEYLKIIGKNIKRIRLLRGLSQETLSDRLDKSVNLVSLIERGESSFSTETLINICKILEVDANAIFEGVIAPPVENADDFITKSLALFSDTDKTMVTDLITYIVNSKT